MFARTAKVLTLERQHAVRAQVRQTLSKIQEPDRLNAALRCRRPVLMRRWQLDPANGKPVCAWEVDSPDLSAEPCIGPNRPMRERQLLCIAVLPRRAAVAGALRPTSSYSVFWPPSAYSFRR